MLEHLETQLRRELRLKEQYDPADLITLMRDPLPWLCKLLPDLTQEIVLSWGKFDGEARMVEAETRELLLGYAGFDPKKITIGAKGIIKPRLNINRLKSLAAKKRASRNLVRAAKSLEAFRLNIAADTKLDSYFAYQVCIMANLEYNEVPAELNLTVHDFIDQAIYSLRSSYYRIRSVTRKADHEPDAFSSWARPQEINPKTAQFLSEQFSRAFAGPIIKGEASDLELAAFLPRVPLNGFILGDFSVINSWLPKGSVDSVLSIKSLTFAPKRLLENLKETLRLLSPTGIAFLDLATSYRGDLPMNSISYLIRDVEFTDYNFYLIWGSDQPIVIATGSKVPRSTIEKFNPDLVDLKEGEKAEGSIVMLQIIEAVASRIQDVMGQNVFRKGCILRAIKNFTIIFLFNNAQVETTDIQRIADQVISSCALTMVLRDDD
jgi:hypothetical protein